MARRQSKDLSKMRTMLASETTMLIYVLVSFLILFASLYMINFFDKAVGSVAIVLIAAGLIAGFYGVSSYVIRYMELEK